MAGPGIITFPRTDAFSSHVAHQITQMRDGRVITDFEIRIRDEVLPCHLLVVITHSEMLRDLLTSDIAEAAKQYVQLDTIDLSVVKTILDFMYAGTISFQTDQLMDMFSASSYLKIPILTEMCIQAILPIIQPHNVITWLQLSKNLNSEPITSRCLEIVAANFSSVSKQPAFVGLGIASLQTCLQHVQECSQPQDDVLHAALSWVQSDCGERLQHLESLVAEMEVGLCSLQGLLEAINSYTSLISKNEEVLSRLTAAALQLSSTKPKAPSKPTLIIAAGDVDEEASKMCWELNADDKVVELAEIPFDLQIWHSVCSTPEGFIISGGRGSTLCIMFNAAAKKWVQLQHLLAARRAHGSILIKGVLYAIGGFVDGDGDEDENEDGDEDEDESSSVHSLELDNGSWQEEKDAPLPLDFPKVAEIEKNIFVLDQDTGQLLHMAVAEKVWTKKESPQGKSCWAVSMTSHNGKLYVAGPDVFAWYIPATDTWVEGKKPNKVHEYGSLVTYNAKLLLLGGSLSDGTDEVEEYDFDTESWTTCPWKMPASLYNHHALVLNLPEDV